MIALIPLAHWIPLAHLRSAHCRCGRQEGVLHCRRTSAIFFLTPGVGKRVEDGDVVEARRAAGFAAVRAGAAPEFADRCRQ